MKISTKGNNEIIAKLEKVSKKSSGIIKRGIYKSADIIADELKAQLKAIPIDQTASGNPRFVRSGDKKLKGITVTQREDLVESMGISKMEEVLDSVNVSVSVDGYGRTESNYSANGLLPNPLLLRSIESGTYFREKIPVVRTARNKSRKRAVEAMRREIELSIEKEMK